MTEPITDEELAQMRRTVESDLPFSGRKRLIARLDLERNRADHEHLRADIQMHGAIAARAEAESLAGLVERTEEKLHAAEAEVERLRALLAAVPFEAWRKSQDTGDPTATHAISEWWQARQKALAPKPKEPSE